MSTNKERDTHFANAAKLLFGRVMATGAMDTVDADRFLDDGDRTELQTLFAQFAYDLAVHVITETQEGLIEHIPDLTQWPPS